MEAYIQQTLGDLNSFEWKENGKPKCGEDFCDSCGDCLNCYGEDKCLSGTGKHMWAVYKS